MTDDEMLQEIARLHARIKDLENAFLSQEMLTDALVTGTGMLRVSSEGVERIDPATIYKTEDPAIHFCHRFAILMECVMLGGVDKYWDEMGTLLDEYHKARDAWMTAHGQPYVSGFGKD